MITDQHIETAERMGAQHARAEQDLDVLFPADPLDSDDDRRDLLWKITGAKIGTEDDERADDLLRAYEEAYWNVWDED